MDIIKNYIKHKKKINALNIDPIEDLIINDGKSDLLSKLTYIEISNDWQKVLGISDSMQEIFYDIKLERGNQFLFELKGKTINYMSTRELEYDFSHKDNFIIYMLSGKGYLVNYYNIPVSNSKLFVFNDISSYVKHKDNENAINNIFNRVLKNVSEYVEIHGSDSVYTNNSCGPINVKNVSGLKMHALSNEYTSYMSSPVDYTALITEYRDSIGIKVYDQLIGRIRMKQMYKGQGFFDIVQLFRDLNIRIDCDKMEVYGNRIALSTLLEFFTLYGEIPFVYQGNSIKVESMVVLDKFEIDIKNLLAYHGYEFVIEKSVSGISVIYIYLKFIESIGFKLDNGISKKELIGNN